MIYDGNKMNRKNCVFVSMFIVLYSVPLLTNKMSILHSTSVSKKRLTVLFEGRSKKKKKKSIAKENE